MTESLAQRMIGELDWLRLPGNPVLRKNFRSRMRAQAVFQFLLVFIIAGFITVITYVGLENFEVGSVQSARVGIIPMLGLQAAILMLAGTGRVTSGVIHERVTGTLDYTRLAPMSPMTKVAGYLFGLPVREYLLFALTLPFMIFLLVMGQVPLMSVIAVYLVFFSSVLLYHLIGLVFGLVLKEWRMSVLFTQGVVILINLILPLFSNFGFPFLQFLTIRPVVYSKIMPLLPQNAETGIETAAGVFAADVAFFNLSVSTTVFSLLVQGMLIFTLGLMVYRKWKDAFNKSLSKLYAIGFFIGLQIFCIGTMWPNLTGSADSDLARGLLPGDFDREQLSFMLPLVYCYVTVLLLFWLIYVITPSHDEYRSGLIRRRKYLHTGWRGWSVLDDKASAAPAALVLALLSMLFVIFIQTTLGDVGAFAGMSFLSTEFLRLPVTTMLIIMYYALALENLEFQRLSILGLIMWLLPLLLAILAAVAFNVEQNWAYIASISPFALLALSTVGLFNDMATGEEAGTFALLNRAYWVGLAVTIYIIAYLAYESTLLRRKIRASIERTPVQP